MTKTNAKTKAFDCVAMKRRIQQELLDEIGGDSLHEELDALHKLAEQSPLWNKLRKQKAAAAKTKKHAKRQKAG